MAHSCSTETIAKVVREYEGVRRKHSIGEMVRALKIDAPHVVASFGEDAAVIEHNDEVLLLAADGIWSRLMEADPYWAGYCSVLVNIHDIAAMGGHPIAMVDIFSIAKTTIQELVVKGMHDASAQFGVPIVGGHLHPDAPYSVIDVSILGSAQKDSVIYSHTAKEGDVVVAAIDLIGRVHPSCALNWDSVTMKSAAEVRAQIRLMEEIGKRHLVTAGKDISNPGLIGTLGMLLEVSGKGAEIDLGMIPKPDLAENNMTFEQWVRMYPGMGFVLTAKKDHVPELSRLFTSVGMTAREIGTVNNTRELRITYNGQETQVFDFIDNGIMHLSDEDVECLPPVKRIGIGIAEDVQRVLSSAGSVGGKFITVCYCRPGIIDKKSIGNSVEIVEHEDPGHALVADLMAGTLDAAVRGTLPANSTLRALKKAEGVDHLERIALLETVQGKKFLLTPVGVDEGWTVPEKLELIKKGRQIAQKFGLPERVGVLSGGRLGDVGRHSQVDTSMAEAELVARLGGADHCEILIEDAVETCGLIIAPDGISGNLIFRTLIFLGGGHGHGAPVVNISRIFVDTSRASPNYANALLLAASLLE